MKSVIRPLLIAPSIAPMVTNEPNMENYQLQKLKKKSEEKSYINVNEKGKLEYYPQQEID